MEDLLTRCEAVRAHTAAQRVALDALVARSQLCRERSTRVLRSTRTADAPHVTEVVVAADLDELPTMLDELGPQWELRRVQMTDLERSTSIRVVLRRRS